MDYVILSFCNFKVCVKERIMRGWTRLYPTCAFKQVESAKFGRIFEYDIFDKLRENKSHLGAFKVFNDIYCIEQWFYVVKSSVLINVNFCKIGQISHNFETCLARYCKI